MNSKSFFKFHLEISNEKNRVFFIKDPIYGEINFEEEYLWIYDFINTPEFQRLADIKQLGFTFNNFPGAVHNRLSHSLGCYELCKKFIFHFIQHHQLSQADQSAINLALLASLLHDIGHGPYSHSFEKVCDFNHENMTQAIIESPTTKTNYLLREKALKDGLREDFYVSELLKIFNKTTKYTWIVELISSEVDVDRLDYIQRDQHHSGVKYGNIDSGLLIKWSTLVNVNGELRFLFLEKAKYLIFNFFVIRQYLYLDIYTNAISLVYESLFSAIFKELRLSLPSLAAKDHFYKDYLFLKDEPSTWEVSSFLNLTDSSVNCLLNKLSQLEDKSKISSLCNLILGYPEQSEFKFLKLFEEDYEKFKSQLPNTEFIWLEKVNHGKSNIKNEHLFFDEKTSKVENIKFALTQESLKSFYLAIITNKCYLDWIKIDKGHE